MIIESKTSIKKIAQILSFFRKKTTKIPLQRRLFLKGSQSIELLV
jgi:hypothetical protein